MGTRCGRVGRAIACAMLAPLLAEACTTGSQQGQAPASARNERQCFLASMVNGFTPLDRDTVHVTVGARTVYELETAGYCPEINWTHRIAIHSRTGSDWVCRGFDADLVVPSALGSGLDRCPVTSVRRLTPEEVRARRR